MNTVEKQKFYRPFEEKDEIKLCVDKFIYFLDCFPDVIENIESYKTDWVDEVNLVESGLKQLSEDEAVQRHPELGLFIRKTKEPIHYYALFAETYGYDIVLSLYSNNRYELEFKYTTWVDVVSRNTLPRINLSPLAKKLNTLEQSRYKWSVDKITDTGPILRLEESKIHKADRYANPLERSIYSSSIEEVHFIELVTRYLKEAYSGISAKRFWTWKESKLTSNLN